MLSPKPITIADIPDDLSLKLLNLDACLPDFVQAELLFLGQNYIDRIEGFPLGTCPVPFFRYEYGCRIVRALKEDNRFALQSRSYVGLDGVRDLEPEWVLL
jgi:hypothetical protein